MTRDDWRDWMIVVGGLLMFGTLALFAGYWIASIVWTALPWMLFAGMLLFGAGYIWEMSSARTVEITAEPREDEPEERLRRAA